MPDARPGRGRIQERRPGTRRGQEGVTCEFSKFEASGSELESTLACTGPGGVNVNMDMDGTIEPTRSAITMRMSQKNPQLPGGEMRMAMEVKSERIGDCK
ncbi:DUF3617 family protein [Altererythrobacter sp. H2]|uniref:DUF3617 domain-containing protein n=1 Tax=Altererythrobacter sp. H2 TaxID=3108391 RepID=UPI002B4BA5A4|nr:DUF3617 family protein [Altererythrobacter sp. H2]WRK95006.1 DUF3617 family protein [Altererythrobacter sp. H2]